MVILNLGGEGEDPEAIDLNTLVSPQRSIVAIRRPGWLIEADFLVLPIRTDSIDEVRGNMVPLRLDRGHGEMLAAESLRVLRPGGRIRLGPTLPAEVIVPYLAAAGYAALTLQGGIVRGVKP